MAQKRCFWISYKNSAENTAEKNNKSHQKQALFVRFSKNNAQVLPMPSTAKITILA